MKKLFWFVALAGCATPFQKEGIFTNGYSEKRKSSDIFIVTFRANEYTSPETVLEHALKRAAQVSLKNGFSYFSVLETKELSYPSLRLTIQCFHEKPSREVYEAKALLSL